MVLVFCNPSTNAQMITGVWQGKINRQKAEVKIIQQGDSLTGTSYYYESANNYRRYSIRGYFDETTNAVVWWDDRLIEEKSGRFSISSPGKIPLLTNADFNCPGEGRMMLDGKTSRKDNEQRATGDVHLDKINQPYFEDEWDFVIDNYTVGANDPYIIDSIAGISNTTTLPPAKTSKSEEQLVIASKNPLPKPEKSIQKIPETGQAEPVEVSVVPVKAPDIQEKFQAREKVLNKEIPVTGDTVELRFYDNAEIDGDSISLFLNGKLLVQNIRLTGKAHVIKLAVQELQDSNELVMVAENLGTIPPNTSYMVAIVNRERYDAWLASTEGSSAMIRFVKK
jgi:hypothetical protein